ncbi:hypothetical protein F5B20DRAFT_595296 [Whalleya microplaca]|nr:hypothetical protein F5B20DRAFT_595296 [Whalleya microplaca]
MDDLFAKLRRIAFGNNYIASSDGSNNAENNCNGNEIDQYGVKNKCLHEKDNNNTGQKGDGHSTEVNGCGNGTLQIDNYNTSNTRGDDNRIAQRGQHNVSTATGVKKTIIQTRIRDEYKDGMEDTNKEYIPERDRSECVEWYKWLLSHWPWNTKVDRLQE